MSHAPIPPGSIIALAALAIPIILVPLVLLLKFRIRKREWDHLERMRSLELGVPLPVQHRMGGVVAIGAGVPIVAFVTALVATAILLSETSDLGRWAAKGGDLAYESSVNIPKLGIIWGSAFSTSCFALIIALILGIMQARTYSKALQSSSWTGGYAKPAFDPDTYDFAGTPR